MEEILRDPKDNCVYYHIDSFTSERFEGNPAGVILTPRALPDRTMLRLAGELQLECAFAAPIVDAEADFAVAYYTGACRVPLCGHDTIALGVALSHRGVLRAGASVRICTDVGVLELAHREEGWFRMSQAAPELGAFVSMERLADVLRIDIALLADHAPPPRIVSTGTPFLLAAVRDRATLDMLDGGTRAVAEYLAALPGAPMGLYCWALSDLTTGADVIRARCFCPGAGLPEDPVTGSACGALGAYLARSANRESAKYVIRQGDLSRRSGYVRVEWDNGRVRVSGQGTIVAHGSLCL